MSDSHFSPPIRDSGSALIHQSHEAVASRPRRTANRVISNNFQATLCLPGSERWESSPGRLIRVGAGCPRASPRGESRLIGSALAVGVGGAGADRAEKPDQLVIRDSQDVHAGNSGIVCWPGGWQTDRCSRAPSEVVCCELVLRKNIHAGRSVKHQVIQY